ncbi:MAG TPA: MgtC/SapB family protein [Tepidisphaeraceae bacterium]|nr:MgtC/SapB family protein [Tepidisphaeraceae bacterium]
MFSTVAMSNLFQLPEWPEFAQTITRLVAAALFGGLIGWERERKNRAAGLRTHMLVAVGSALFMIGSGVADAPGDARSRVIQGIIAGIGFLGAGTIIKLTDRAEVQGLTTAASIFATAAIGMTTACTALWLPFLGTLIALATLHPLQKLEQDSPSNPSGDSEKIDH